MPRTNERRILDGLESLVNALLPTADHEAKEAALHRAKHILTSEGPFEKVTEANSVAETIRTDLIGSPSIHASLRFNELYARLITQPILNQKWQILFFLNRISVYVDHVPLPKFFDEEPSDEYEEQEVEAEPEPEQESESVSARLVPSETSRSFIPNATKTSILRDLPFALQGVSSVNFRFLANGTIQFPDNLPPTLTCGPMHALGEPALLFKSLRGFIDSPGEGLLRQSLCAALEGGLRSYLTVVSALEKRIREAAQSEQTLVTLNKCVVWMNDSTLGLRLLDWIHLESKDKKGGQIISLIHNLSTHGDPLIERFTRQLLPPITRPFYDMLRKWIYDGELADPFHEFFVHEQDPLTVHHVEEGRGRGAATSVWEDKYKLDHDMIPSIITEDFAQKVFLIGKSLNFIRHSCNDSAWVEQYSKGASKELHYGDTETLETWIDEAHKTTMNRLIHLMAEKFHLFKHLRAYKDYILLGQGDFISLLMESLAPNLDRPAGTQYRHNLTAQLEHAIRSSNAQFDSPEVLRRLDARMLTSEHGDIGWDCFTLEYKVDSPIDVIVTDWGNRQYLKVFNFLWRIKRVEFALTTTWRRYMTGSRGVLQTSDAEIQAAWKNTRGAVGEMIHFINQLQYYILFEVIESSWDDLQVAIHKEGCTLDDMLKAHTTYLGNITHKGLLGAKQNEKSSFMEQLKAILKVILLYKEAVDGLYGWCVAEFSRNQVHPTVNRTASSAAQTDHFNNTSTSFDAPPTSSIFSTTISERESLATLVGRLSALAAEYRSKTSVLLADLAHQPDVDMRFLGVVMNFNDFYALARRGKRVGKVNPGVGGGVAAVVGATA